MLNRILVGVIVALLLWSGVQGWRVRRAQRAAGKEALAADTTRAHFDTTRQALTGKDSSKLLGDSLASVQRLVVQVKQSKDDFDRALKLQRIAMQELTGQIKALTATVQSSTPTTETPEGARAARFDVRQEPYTVVADVTLPTPPAKGNLAVRVNLDPATVNLRLGCGPANGAGIRSATATATGPQWLALTLGRVEQAPELCASPALQSSGGRWGGLRRWLPHPSIGYGATMQDSAGVLKFRRGWQAGLYVDVWRP